MRAWKIDPGSKEVAEALRTRGYRRVKDEWVEASPGAAPEAAANPGGADSQRPGAATTQVGCGARRSRRPAGRLGGEPERKSFSGTKGQLIEQWMFLEPGRVHYVNFLHTPGEVQPRVVSDYFLPRSLVKGDLKPAR